MKTYLLAATVAGLLATSGAAIVVMKVAPLGQHSGAGADLDALHGGTAGDGPHAQLGMERLAFPKSSGSVPTAAQAEKLEQLSYVDITNDTMFNPSNGVRGGSGTLEDPFVISGYTVTGDLWIGDTTSCFEVKDNWIDGQLHLNWNGPCVFVHHNFIRDLRVNENIHRTGVDTGGLIEMNTINYVGQIRHYDGEFRNNVVGPRDDARLPEGIFHDPENVLPFVKDTRVLNVDGFNQGYFHHNTIVGSTDLKLHGHHHGTGFLATHSHYHGDGEAPMAHEEDHTQRWKSVRFVDNKITDPTGYGLRYTDEAHAGDDRTAASESTEMLEEPHVHYTDVVIARNELEGAGILVDVFNADDELHKQFNPGFLTIADNKIHIKERDRDVLGSFVFFGPRYAPNVGIRVWEAKEMQLSITGNEVTFEKSGNPDPLEPLGTLDPVLGWFSYEQTPTGIRLEFIRNATVTVADNTAKGFDVGVGAGWMEADVQWAVYGNSLKENLRDVFWDDTVINRPQDEPFPPQASPAEQYPPPAAGGHEHHHGH